MCTGRVHTAQAVAMVTDNDVTACEGKYPAFGAIIENKMRKINNSNTVFFPYTLQTLMVSRFC